MNGEEGGASNGAGPMALFLIFLRLGLTSFGGPVAHLGYFRTEFVARRRWFSDASYADLVALCQFLPGPASSQVGFAIGLIRNGWPGGIMAWAGFTLPSAVLMLVFAHGANVVEGPFAEGVIGGLKILAVAVVGHALLGMGRSLCPDRPRLALALAALLLLSVWHAPLAQIVVIGIGAAVGLASGFGRKDVPVSTGVAGGTALVRTWGPAWILLTVAIFVAGPLLLTFGVGGQGLALFDAFFRAGSLVFGGGHVVLPLLKSAVVGPGWVTPEQFLAGYGAAQALPGPLFTFAAFLGASAGPEPNGIAGALVALAGVSLPGLLLVAGFLPFWDRFRAWPAARSVLAGVNAAVVGVLAAAFHDPVFVGGIRDPLDFAIASVAFFALVVWRLPVWWVVAGTALAGGLSGVAGL